MDKREERLRLEAIKRYLGGDEPSSIYRDIERSKSWFFKWLNRNQYGDHHWYKELSRAPKLPQRALDPHMEQLIIQIRKNSKIQSMLRLEQELQQGNLQNSRLNLSQSGASTGC